MSLFVLVAAIELVATLLSSARQNLTPHICQPLPRPNHFVSVFTRAGIIGPIVLVCVLLLVLGLCVLCKGKDHVKSQFESMQDLHDKVCMIDSCFV